MCIRDSGYGYREIGPRIETDRGLYSVGAKNVLVASAEYERYFTPTLSLIHI